MSIFKGLFRSVCNEVISSALNRQLKPGERHKSRTRNDGKADQTCDKTPGQAGPLNAKLDKAEGKK